MPVRCFENGRPNYSHVDHHGQRGCQVEDVLGGISVHGLAGPDPIAVVGELGC
jgi:hypothetical protein